MVLSMAGRSTNGEFGVRRMLRPLPLPAEHRTHAVQPVIAVDGIRSGLGPRVKDISVKGQVRNVTIEKRFASF